MSGAETEMERKARSRLERINKARAALAARFAEDPAAVAGFNQRMLRLGQARKREPIPYVEATLRGKGDAEDKARAASHATAERYRRMGLAGAGTANGQGDVPK